MSQDRLSILIQAILSKSTEQEFEAELKKIEQKLKPFKVTATLDDKQLDKFTQKFETIAGEHEKLTQEIREYKNNLSQTVKVIDDIDKETQSVYKSTELITDNYKKQRAEIEKIKALEDKQANQEYVRSMTAKMLEIEQRNNAEKQREIELEKQAQQEYVNSMMAQIRAIEKRNAEEERLAGILETNAQKLELFKQKMIGDDVYKGEIDIVSKKYGKKIDADALKDIKDQVLNLSANTPDLENKIKSLGIQFSSLKQQASQSGTVMGRMFDNMTKFMRFYLVGGLLVKVINELKNGISTIVELDASLTELNKVSDLTSSQLQKITKDAYEAGVAIGRTGKEVIDATTEFKRAGYEIQEAFNLAQNALVLTNIGDGITDVKEASSSIIAVLKGFKMEANETMHVIDALNEVSNNYAVDTNNLTEIMKRVSGTIAQTGTSYEQLLGLATGGFESLRNAEMVASGINMISQRLRGMSESGESVEGLIPKIQEAFDKYAKGSVSIIDKQNGGLNDTYTILKQLSKVYPTLTDEQRAYLNEAIAGNRQNRVLIAIMENWKNVESAVVSAKNSTGSALKENEKYLNSINGKMAQFKSSTQQLWQNLISSDVIKFFVDLGTIVVKTLDAGFVRFIATVALVTTSIGLLIKGFTLLKNSMLTTTIQYYALMAATEGLKTAAIDLWGTLSVSPLFWVAAGTAAIYGLVKVFDALTVSVEEQREKVDELNKGYNELKDKIKSLRAVQNPTKEQIEYIGLLERELELQGEILKIEQKRLMEKEVYGSGRLAKEVEKNLQTIDEYTEGMKYAQSELQRVLSTYTEEELLKYSDDDTWIEHIEDLKNQTKELELELIKQKTTIDDYIKTLGNEAPQKLKDLSKSIGDALPKIQALNGGIKNTDTTTEKYIPTLEELTKAYEEATDAIDNYQSSAKQLSDIYDTINEDGKVSADTLIDLIQKYPQLASEIANMNSSKEAGLNLTKQLFELEKANAIAELTDNKAILDSKLSLLEADEKKYKLMREIAMQNNDSYGVGQASKLLAALDLGDLRNQSNSIVQAIEMITGLKLDDFKSKSSGSSSTSKTLTEAELVDQSKLTKAFIKSANAQAQITEQQEKSLKAQQKLAESQKDYNKQIELTNKLIANEQQQISDLQTANEKINQRANEIRASEKASKYDTTQWFSPTGESTAAYDNFIISFADRKNKIIADMNKLEAKDSLLPKEKQALVDFQNQLNALETEQKLVEDLFASIQKLKKAYTENADTIINLNDSIAASEQKKVDINKSIYSDDLKALKDNYDLGIISTEQYYQSLKDLFAKYKDFLSSNDKDAYNSLQKEQQSAYNKIYDEELKELKKNHKQGNISTKQYFKSLMQLAEKYSEFLKANNKDAWDSLVSNIQNTDSLITKEYEDLQKDVIDILKKRYDQEEKLRKQQYDDTIRKLDDEKKAYQDYINSRIDELDRLYATEDYRNTIGERTQAITDIQSEISKYSLASANGDIEAISKIATLQEQLAEEEKKLAEEQNKRERDLRKQSLQDNLKDFENYIDDKKRVEEDSFDEFKQNIEKATDETALQIEAQKLLMQNSIQDAQSSLLKLFEETGINASETGKILQDEIINRLLQIRDLEKQVKSIAPKKSDPNYGSIPGYTNGGINTTTGLAMLHGTSSRPEWILNTEQMKKLVNGLAFGNIVSKFNIPQISNNKNVAGGINLGGIVINAQKVDENSIPQLVKEVAKVFERKLNLVGIPT